MPHSVLLVCDEPLWARSAKEILESRGYTVTAPPLSKLHPLDILRSNHWEVCLLSICQKHWDGIEILKIAKVDFPTRKILYFYPDSNRMEGAVAREVGADMILPKSICESDFIEAVLSFFDGSHDSASRISGDQPDLFQRIGPHGAFTLSAREKQILALIAQGMTYRDIASLKNLSLSTVNTYRRRLIVKTGAKNGRELLLYAMKSVGLGREEH